MIIVTIFQVSMTSIVFQLFSKIEFSGVDPCFYERVPVGCERVVSGASR